MQTKLKLAIIGTAHVHTGGAIAEALEHPEVELIGVALPDTDSPVRVPEGITIFDSLSDLPEHDVAIIMTDIDTHDSVIPQLGCQQVFIEKPLAVNAARAESLAAALESSQMQVEIGYFLRRSPELGELRESIRNGELGSIRHVNMQFGHSGISAGWLTRYPAHMSTGLQGYGTFGDLASHLLDYAGWVFGELTPVSCHIDTEPGMTADTQGNALLQTADGTRISLWTSGVSAVSTLSIDIFGDQGAARLRDGQLTITGADGQARSAAVELSSSAALRTSLDRFLGKDVPRSTSLSEAIQTNRLLDRLYELAGA